MTSPPEAPSLREVVTGLQAALDEPLGALRGVVLSRKLSLEGAIRRGLIAMNGAGLIAVISLAISHLTLKHCTPLHTISSWPFDGVSCLGCSCEIPLTWLNARFHPQRRG